MKNPSLILACLLMAGGYAGCDSQVVIGEKPEFPNTPAGRQDFVAKAMNTAEIVPFTTDSRDPAGYDFVVRTQDGAVWYIHVDSMRIYEKIQLLPPTPKTNQSL